MDFRLHQNGAAPPSTRQIREFISPFQIQDYVKYSKKFYGRNVIFYTNLLSEFSFYQYYQNRNLYQTSFVNLYRLFEYISYSFPMIHAAHFGRLSGSYSNLRSFFVGEKTSEIKFFELFINELFSGDAILNTITSFDFNQIDTSVSQNCFETFRKLLKQNEWHAIDRANFMLSVENKYLIRLLKNLRNRYFHFAIGGQSNIGTADIKDPEFFFSKTNDAFANWFGRIYKETIKEIIDNSLI